MTPQDKYIFEFYVACDVRRTIYAENHDEAKRLAKATGLSKPFTEFDIDKPDWYDLSGWVIE